ncbi:MAG: DUF6785 family protein [Thermoproteota archaeon]
MTEKITEKPISSTILITCAIIAIIQALIVSFQGPFLRVPLGCAQSLGSPVMMTGADFPGWPLVALLVIIALQQIPSFRRYISRTNLAYLFVAMVCVDMVGGVLSSNDPVYLVGRSQIPSELAQYLPEFFSLPVEASEVLISGVAGNYALLPLGAILPAVMWRFIMFALFSGIMLSISNIIRREWISVEKIPFPYTLAYHSMLTNVEGMVMKEWPTKKFFLLGIAAGFLLCFPIGATNLFPWFPDIYSWKSNTCGPGSHWIAPVGMPWHLGMNKHPTTYALFLLVPIHSLFSILFYLLVLEVGLFVSYAMGYYTAMPDLGFCGRNWCAPTPYVSEPLFFSIISAGATIGLFVSTIFQQRNYIAWTLRAAFGSIENKDEIERGEPTTYRTSWISLIIFFILMLIFFMVTGLSPWLSFVVSFAGILTWMVMAQVWGRVGMAFEPCYDVTPTTIRLMAWPTEYNPLIDSMDKAMVPLLSREHIAHFASAGFGGAFYASLLSYKMADLSGIDNRSVLKIIIVSLFPALFVFLITKAVILPGLLPGTRIGFTESDFSGDILWNFWNRPVEGPLTQGALHLLIGFLFMLVGRILYTKFMWMPDPLVAIVAWGWGISLWGAWVPILVAWIVKTLVLKIGGSKLYESMIVPLASGLILGEVLEVLTLTLLGLTVVPAQA